MNLSQRNVLQFLLKLLVTAGCLWWLSSYVDLDAVRASLAGFAAPVMLVAIVFHICAYLVGSVRWWYLFHHLVGAVRFAQILPSYYLGVFFNNVLPSAYGGDVARSARLYLSGMSGSALIGSALADRLLGLAAVVSMGGMALMFTDMGAFGMFARWGYAACAALVLFALAMILLFDWGRVIDSRYGRRWPRLHAVLSCFSAYRKAPGLILKGFLLSVLNQLLVVAVFVLLAREAGIGVPVAQLVAILMLVFLVASVPVSLGGLGPREGSLMVLLLPLGVEAHAILALSIAYLIVLWCSAFPGLFMLFVRAGQAAGNRKTPAP